MNGDRICIVTPGYIASTPRVVKEADALSAAGFDVTVVSGSGPIEGLRRADEGVVENRAWTWRPVVWPDENAGLAAWAVHQVARRLPGPLTLLPGVAERADRRITVALGRAAGEASAALYIGHYPAGLAAAAAAARRHRSRYAYDAEDLHTAEGSDTAAGRRDARRVGILERRYLPGCSHVTAASAGIGAALSNLYGIAAPTAIRNVFPLSEWERLDGERRDRPVDAGLSLYWYSQTLGPDRGIQDVIRAAGRMAGPVQIHLRGAASDETRQALIDLAEEEGVADSLCFHAKVPPSELLSRAVEHDVGLALFEPGENRSRAITVTNKLFFYLLAGIPVGASDVPGQRSVLLDRPDLGFLYRSGDADALARELERLRESPARLQEMKEAARTAAREEFNWEREAPLLVETVRRSLAGEAR